MNAKNVFHAALTTLAMGTIGASQVPAQQPSLLNPLTWCNSPTYNSRTYNQPCATGNCPPSQMYRPAVYQQPAYQSNYAPAVYQSNYAPAVADTYYYPTNGTNILPAGGVANPACPGGVCPTNVPMNCSNGQCYPVNCPNGQCLPGSGNVGPNFGTNYAPGYAPVAPAYPQGGSFYGPTGSATSPYYTTQVNNPVNYSTTTYPVSQNFLPMNNGQYNNGQYGNGQYNGQYGNGQVNGGYVPPFRTRAVDLPESYNGGLR